MTKRAPIPMLLCLVAAGAALLGAVACARADAPAVGAPSPDSALARAGAKKGFLFSAVSLADSAPGREWARLRPEALAQFPDLRLPRPEDLHITVVYVGGDWSVAGLDRVRPLAVVVPGAAGRMRPEVVRMGRNRQVVAVELHGAPAAWRDSVIAAKLALNRLGLKKPDVFDTDFRTHVTLAQARNNPPSAADSTALDACQAWLTRVVAAAPERFSVTLGPRTPVRLLLAGATRPEGAPEYVTVEEFLERQLGAGGK
jgi:hypothetical protein